MSSIKDKVGALSAMTIIELKNMVFLSWHKITEEESKTLEIFVEIQKEPWKVPISLITTELSPHCSDIMNMIQKRKNELVVPTKEDEFSGQKALEQEIVVNCGEEICSIF